MGGFGSAVLEFLAGEGIVNLPVRCMGLPDRFIEQGPQDLLRKNYGLSADGIFQQAMRLLAHRSGSEPLHGEQVGLGPA